MTNKITLQPCPPEQHTLLRSWIQQLADYEGKPEAVTITNQRLQELLRKGSIRRFLYSQWLDNGWLHSDISADQHLLRSDLSLSGGYLHRT